MIMQKNIDLIKKNMLELVKEHVKNQIAKYL